MFFHRKSATKAFTLIELLVAMAVLALMTVLLAQMLQSTSQSWLGGQARVNNFAKARSMMDLMARDVQSGVFRADLAMFAGASSGQAFTNMAFYTLRPGVPSSSGASVRDVSLVQYSVDSASILQRGDLAIPWDGTAATNISFGTTNALPQLPRVVSRETASGVVGFQILFMQRDGTLSKTYDPALSGKGIAIGMAVVDDNTLKRLEAAGKIDDLQSALAGTLSGTNSVKAEWDAFLQSGFNWGDYPPNLARGLKIFERYVVFP
jgi:prepilin-type N-terminal cleavage/methylation domain-containing protein